MWLLVFSPAEQTVGAAVVPIVQDLEERSEQQWKVYWKRGSQSDTGYEPAKKPLGGRAVTLVFNWRIPLEQGWGTSGLRAVYGPRDHLIRPSR